MKIKLYLKSLLMTLSLLFPLVLSAKVIEVKGVVKDTRGDELIGVSVRVKGANQGATTGIDGRFVLKADEKDILVFSYVGYEPKELKASSKFMTVVLHHSKAVLEAVVVSGYASLKSKSVRIPKRPKEVSPQVLASPAQGYPMVQPGMLISEEREGYEKRKENVFELVRSKPLSTLSVDVDVASYGDMRRSISQGQLPYPEAVRVEEFINYFDYKYPQPRGKDPIALDAVIAPCPWNAQHQLVRVGMKAKEIPSEALPASNIVYLIDVSGSMSGANRIGLVKTSLKLLTNNLRPQDKVAIVTYASGTQVLLPSTTGANRTKIKEAIDGLQSGGATAGASGIKLAYEEARKNFIKGGNNRIILCTDGDFNVGVSSPTELEELITQERQSGVFLTVLGYGMGNYKDKKLQILAEKGNGNHAYIDTAEEANKVLVQEFGSTMYAVAKDVKLQVEFNPSLIAAYRLIGYESRLLEDADFNDDTKDAAELGAGHTVTALYEVVPVGVQSEHLPKVDTLRYQTNTNGDNKSEYLTIKLRYKPLNADKSELISLPLRVADASKRLDNNTRLAAAVALYGELLRGSKYIGKATYADVLRVLEGTLDNDPFGEKHELLQLVRTAESLSKLDKKAEE